MPNTNSSPEELFAIGRLTSPGPLCGQFKRFKLPLHLLSEAQEIRETASKEDKQDFINDLPDPADQLLAYVLFNKLCRDIDFVQQLQDTGVTVVCGITHGYVIGTTELLTYKKFFEFDDNHVKDDWE